ncbi:hypothetical protein PPYR_09786 [Photinus pyralis]|uniref:Major facilitator superfamily (MFS) profile domain-containing protein n=1 Tax=Photinus pyralis TaxID=7054 RepID=A0A5N4AEH0_PHOPY|nr:hypothetical protein PPYR_09786 [Photinus pyralis]
MSVGTMISRSTAGLVIQAFGWEYVFYIFGVTGLLWCFAWYTLMYNKPETHPRINLVELAYIQTKRDQSLNGGKGEVPWLKIFCSLPMWAIAISSFGRMWFASVIMMYGPMYLKTVIGLNVQMNGLLSSTISCATFFASIIFSFISDKISTHQLLSTITNRKLFTAIGHIIPGVLCISMSYSGCNQNIIIAVWALVQIAASACFAGAMVNTVDIAPNFTGPVASIIQTIMVTPDILSTMVAKNFLQQGSNLDSWRNIFNISAGMYFGTYLFYHLFASADVGYS